jgi:hypothetical protein
VLASFVALVSLALSLSLSPSLSLSLFLQPHQSYAANDTPSESYASSKTMSISLSLSLSLCISRSPSNYNYKLYYAYAETGRPIPKMNGPMQSHLTHTHTHTHRRQGPTDYRLSAIRPPCPNNSSRLDKICQLETPSQKQMTDFCLARLVFCLNDLGEPAGPWAPKWEKY